MNNRIVTPSIALAFFTLAAATCAFAATPAQPVVSRLPDPVWGAIEEHAEDLFERLDTKHRARAVSDSNQIVKLLAGLAARHPEAGERLAPLMEEGTRLAAAVKAGDWPGARQYANDITKWAIEFTAEWTDTARSVARLDWLGREFVRLHEDHPSNFASLLGERRGILRSEWAGLKPLYCKKSANASLCGRMDGLVAALDADGSTKVQSQAALDLLERVDDLESASHD